MSGTLTVSISFLRADLLGYWRARGSPPRCDGAAFQARHPTPESSVVDETRTAQDRSLETRYLQPSVWLWSGGWVSHETETEVSIGTCYRREWMNRTAQQQKISLSLQLPGKSQLTVQLNNHAFTLRAKP